MRLIGNALNNDYFRNILAAADHDNLRAIRLAVAYVREMNDIFELAKRRNVPLELYCLFDGMFPSKPILKRFVDRHGSLTWQMYLTANFYHPKIYWFEGIGAYIGSANLTVQGRNNNLECGVWFNQDELVGEGLDEQLRMMLRVIRERSTPASEEHVRILDAIESQRTAARKAQSDFEQSVKDALANIPGQQAPIDVTQKESAGGAARRAFVSEWNQTLTILRKLTVLGRQRPRPSWVGAHVHPAIVQDQATESWYHVHIRSTGESATELERLHRQNRGRMEAAIDELFSEWQTFHTDDQFWRNWTNEEPRRLEQLLARQSLREWDGDKMMKLVWGGHASRDHARQMTNATFRLPPDATHDKWARAGFFAEYLMRQQTEAGRRVNEVLEYLFWGEDQNPDCAERLWSATYDPAWKIPHLGVNILGEWIGYARPNEFPPRNNRVSRCLYALGYEGISH
jgi:hypothetical protein